jgi:hypothetical protein
MQNLGFKIAECGIRPNLKASAYAEAPVGRQNSDKAKGTYLAWSNRGQVYFVDIIIKALVSSIKKLAYPKCGMEIAEFEIRI